MVRKFRKRICCLKLRRYIYLISPKKIDNSFYFNLKKVLASNKVVFFQLRLKKTTYNNIIKIGKKIKPITDKFKVKLIINDNPKIAKAINADGCHIGQSDKPFSLTKKILKKKIVGVTCHGSKKLVNRAIKYKADYIALGSFFKSNLKPSAKKASLQVLKEVKKKIEKYISLYSPSTVYLHHSGDVNIDHRITHEAVITACRPFPGQSVKKLLSFEVQSSTEWQPPNSASQFSPNWYVDINNQLSRKIEALNCYSGEMRDWPHSRSVKASEFLAKVRVTMPVTNLAKYKT